MTALLKTQQGFMARILDHEIELPPEWTGAREAGMDIYRNGYRSRLVDALRETFERTARLVGEDAFRQAAAHHLITHPPTSWTLDDAGEGFDETCAELFAGDRDVGELAWLEWAMHRCFTARDVEPMPGASFAEASAGFSEEDWVSFRLAFLPAMMLRPVSFDLVRLWKSLEEESEGVDVAALASPQQILVWREGERPVFILVSDAEGRALEAMRRGATYGETCEMLVETLGEEAAIAEAGAMLGRWFSNGLVSGFAQ